MARKSEPWPPHPAYTNAFFWGKIRSALRRVWMYYPPRQEQLKESRRVVEGKRHRYEYLCAMCKKWHVAKQVQSDHIVECGSLRSYDDLAGFVERMFVGKEGLQTACKVCHKAKTKEARKRGV